MSMWEKLQELENQLVRGWREEIEYTVGGEIRIARQWQKSLLEQLKDEATHPKQSVGGNGKAQFGPSIPGRFQAIELHDEIMRYLTSRVISDDPASLEKALTETRSLVNRTRIMLGYETPKVALADSPCPDCNGILVVARDAHSDVKCVGDSLRPACGKVFRREDWADLLEAVNALVNTTTAVTYTGRPVGTINRWATEGRITRHGKTGPGKALWDVRELPRAVPGQPLPPPPPLPRTRAPTA